MKQVQITPEVIADWKAQCAGQLASGWKFSDVRRQLVRSGCTPQLVEEILRHGQRVARSGDRRQGRGMLALGIVLLLAGIGIAVLQQALVQWTGATRIIVPSGLILGGVFLTGRGLLKSVFG